MPTTATPGVVYDVSADGTYAEVIGYNGTATKVKIASEYKGLPVKTICRGVFQNNSNITNVVIPDTVTSIGDLAFGWCSNLSSVVIGDSVISIGDLAFSNCHSSLYTEYEYGKYVKSGDNPYAVLIELTNKNMSTYDIHEDTQIIAYGVFSSCKRLTSITIPDGVTSIGSSAFLYCSNLSSVVIPDSVTSIGSYAFYGCIKLTDVYYTGTQEQWNLIEIDNEWNNNYNLINATIHYNYVPQ